MVVFRIQILVTPVFTSHRSQYTEDQCSFTSDYLRINIDIKTGPGSYIKNNWDTPTKGKVIETNIQGREIPRGECTSIVN